MTTGRAGSSSLMEVLASQSDIMLPRKQIDRHDDELIREDGLLEHFRQYRKISGAGISSTSELIDLYFDYNRKAWFAGFKSMPHRHHDYQAFIERRDIQFITLFRHDLASTVASLMLAIEKGTWRRSGGDTGSSWRFDSSNERSVRRILVTLRKNQAKVKAIANAIDPVFEDLCRPDFRDSRLERFFGREVTIADPTSPLSGERHTENWDALVSFVENTRWVWQGQTLRAALGRLFPEVFQQMDVPLHV